MEIRTATPADLAAVPALEAACFPPAEAAGEASFQARLAAFPDSFWLLVEGGRVLAMVNGMENAVLVSIHQNSLPSSPVTHGAQTFWNRQEGAEALARTLQAGLNPVVNTHRAKEPKQIPDSIYLMNHVDAPAVLVECGFLSNREEAARLQQADYQKTLAAVIAAGYLRWSAGEDRK